MNERKNGYYTYYYGYAVDSVFCECRVKEGKVRIRVGL
jgi:hypothetical protein